MLIKRYAIGVSLLLLAVGLGAQSIKATDMPDGFAAGGKYKVKTDKAVVVSNKKDLVKAVSKGGLIYIDGMIDMSDGMIPKDGKVPKALDAFVSSGTAGKYANYDAFKAAYVKACDLGTEDAKSGSGNSTMYNTLWELNHKYGGKIRLNIPSGTVIIGLKADCGIYGGSISIKDVSNVVLRNLTLQDAYDPFPHHEANDGYNAQHDLISVQGASNVWIDHCTLEDTQAVSHVMSSGTIDEKWQTYDGLCDITKESKGVTVSYCKFSNHDKTMLIGSSDSEKLSITRTVTLHHNYFHNCGQRLPMVRITNLHTYNNYFTRDDSAFYSSQYALGVRYNANVISEQNCYGKGTKYSFSGSSSKQGTVYSNGDIDLSDNGKKDGQFKVSDKPTFTIPYKYKLDDASTISDSVPRLAGAGIVTVQR